MIGLTSGNKLAKNMMQENTFYLIMSDNKKEISSKNFSLSCKKIILKSYQRMLSWQHYDGHLGIKTKHLKHPLISSALRC